MSIETLPVEPRAFTAGDTVKFLARFRDFSSQDGWELQWVWSSATEKVQADEITPDADGSFEILLSSKTSLTMKPGIWLSAGIVSLAGEMRTASQSRIDVRRNLSAPIVKSVNRKILENLQAKIEGRSLPNQEIEESNINGQQIIRMPSTVLMQWLKFYEAKVGGEDAKAGLGMPSTVRLRF